MSWTKITLASGPESPVVLVIEEEGEVVSLKEVVAAYKTAMEELADKTKEEN